MAIGYKQKYRNELAKTALEMGEGRKDLIEGLRQIYALWTKAGFEENETYTYLKAIDSETDHLIKGSAQDYCSEDFLKQQTKWEQEYLKAEKPFIDELIEKLRKLQIAEENNNV